ncbi:MAG: nucleoside monophosphate kinase [bacterium]|nr:nucleoside monophosphate kinase [bacterium]
MPIAVHFYGIPGAGKGTQADLLSRKKHIVHFDTGPYLKQLLTRPESLHDPMLREQKNIWDTGGLNEPSWVLDIVGSFAQSQINYNQSIIFSCSPHTLFEAFGDAKNQGLVDITTKGYRAENVYIIYLNLPENIGASRNSVRKLCSECRLIVLSTEETKPLTRCITCGAPLETRKLLDAPETYNIRIREYRERTEPVLTELRARNIRVIEINADQEPYVIHRLILQLIS